MHIEDFRAYCLAKAGVTEELPFDDETLVFKVCGKIFAICTISDFDSGINLKCDPAQAVELRETYPNLVLPGYHMNKQHWNTVLPQAGLPDKLLYKWIDDSYLLVAAKLTKAQKAQIGIY